MDEAEGPSSDPMLDDSFEVPATPTGGQMSDMIVDALIVAGVRKGDAKSYAKKVMKHNKSDFIEIYGRGAIVDAANGPHRSLNVRGLDALDLTTLKKSGTHWDFSRMKESICDIRRDKCSCGMLRHRVD